MRSYTDFDIIRSGQSEYITIFLREPSTEDLTDVYASSTFSLIDIDTDESVATATFSASGGTGIDHPGVGVYQYNLDTSTLNGQYLANFRCLLEGEVLNQNIFVKSESAKVFARAAELRLQVDKARKSVSDDIENMDRDTYEPSIRFFYGYSDAHLIFYLERGCQILNAIPPYTGFAVENFPWDQYGTLLVDAAVIAAMESQGIFAIDTDYNYSLGGNSLVIDHLTKINSFLANLLTRFDKNAFAFKQQFRSKGMVVFQWMPGGVRSARQLSAMPSGFWSRMLSSVYT